MNGRTNVNVRNTAYRLGTLTVSDCETHDITPASHGLDYFDRVLVTIQLRNNLQDMCLGHPFDFTEEEVGNSIVHVPQYVVYGTSTLGRVDLPSSVVTIGERAFSATGIDSMRVVSTNLTTAAANAFADNLSLTSAVIDAPNLTSCSYLLAGCHNLTNLSIAHMPVLSDHCFYDNSNLTYVEVPADCTSVGTYAFGLSAEQFNVARTPLYVLFMRHGQWESDGTQITGVPTFAARVFSPRSRSRTFVHVPFDSLAGYRIEMGRESSNLDMRNDIRVFLDVDEVTTLPTTVTQRVGNTVASYAFHWFNHYTMGADSMLGSNPVVQAGRYYASVIVMSEETVS